MTTNNVSTVTSTVTALVRHRARSRLATATATVGVVATWLAPLGPVWLHVPSPAPGVPAADVGFADLAALTAGGPSALQDAYFGWLGWALAGITTALAVVVLLRPGRVLGAVVPAVAMVELVITVLALKGALTWSLFLDGIGNVRLGIVLAAVGIVLLAVTAVLAARASQTPRKG